MSELIGSSYRRKAVSAVSNFKFSELLFNMFILRGLLLHKTKLFYVAKTTNSIKNSPVIPPSFQNNEIHMAFRKLSYKGKKFLSIMMSIT